jgi:hypothetical protein
MTDLTAKQQALEMSATLATVVHAIIRQQYGEEAYEWDPTTVFLEAKDDFHVDMDTAVMDRWSSIQVIMLTDGFFRRLDAFLGICNTLSAGQPFFQMFDPVTVEEAAWAITEVSLNRELLPFSYPVKKYLKTILKQDGYSPEAYPAIFREVFEVRPEASDIRRLLQDAHNQDNVELYIDEQLRDMVFQFNKIPSLKDLDDMIMRKSMDEYVSTLVGKQPVVAR